jgi:hypothetical protein
MKAGDKALLRGEIVTIIGVGIQYATVEKANGTLTYTPIDALTIYKEVTGIIKSVRTIIAFIKSIFKKSK